MLQKEYFDNDSMRAWRPLQGSSGATGVGPEMNFGRDLHRSTSVLSRKSVRTKPVLVRTAGGDVRMGGVVRADAVRAPQDPHSHIFGLPAVVLSYVMTGARANGVLVRTAFAPQPARFARAGLVRTGALDHFGFLKWSNRTVLVF